MSREGMGSYAVEEVFDLVKDIGGGLRIRENSGKLFNLN
jgi:hypothetical protein